jgi:hypothetical protein
MGEETVLVLNRTSETFKFKMGETEYCVAQGVVSLSKELADAIDKSMDGVKIKIFTEDEEKKYNAKKKKESDAIKEAKDKAVKDAVTAENKRIENVKLDAIAKKIAEKKVLKAGLESDIETLEVRIKQDTIVIERNKKMLKEMESKEETKEEKAKKEDAFKKSQAEKVEKRNATAKDKKNKK